MAKITGKYIEKIIGILILGVILWISSNKVEKANLKGYEEGYKKAQDSAQMVISNAYDSIEVIYSKHKKDSIRASKIESYTDSLQTEIKNKDETIVNIRKQVNSYNPDQYDSTIKLLLSRPLRLE